MHFYENAQKGLTTKSYIKIMSYTPKQYQLEWLSKIVIVILSIMMDKKRLIDAHNMINI